MKAKTCTAFVLLLSAVLLGGCGSDSKDKAASQTAAKINGDEVTVHQINAELQRLTGGRLSPSTDAEAAGKRILENLIDQTLLLQQAKASKLDRDPQVLQLLEASRRQILAQAYIDRQVAASPPTEEEVKAFYAKHPDLFEHRRVYAFREFLFDRAKFTDDIRVQLNGAKSPADIAKVLNAAGIRYRETNSRRPAEALPIEALPRIAKLNRGDALAFTDQNLANVLMLIDYAEQGVTMERATPVIKRYLVNQKRREVARTKVKELRAAGKIEYVGKFAEAPIGPNSGDDKSEASTAPGGDSDPKDDAIEKGVSGLR